MLLRTKSRKAYLRDWSYHGGHAASSAAANMIVAVIPARGGSKRIPRKNIRLFLGKPIIGYSIEVAQASGLFDQIIVSTDDAEIAGIAEMFGAETPFTRPKELSGDHTGTNAVVTHAIKWLSAQGKSIKIVCCIYPAAPLIQVRHLIDGYEKLISGAKAFALAVTSFESPVQRALTIRDDGSIRAAFPEHILSRSQDLEELYHDAGQFYWGRADAFLNGLPDLGPHTAAIILPRHLVQDIDTPEDWQNAELMYRALKFAKG